MKKLFAYLTVAALSLVSFANASQDKNPNDDKPIEKTLNACDKCGDKKFADAALSNCPCTDKK